MNIDFFELIFRLKLISGILSVIFFALAVFFIVKFQKLVGLKLEMLKSLIRTPEAAKGGAVQSKWEEIKRHMESTREAEWKFAVVEADKMVDDLLKRAGYLGDSMGERLMNIEKGQLLSMDGLWEAHKIRNRLVHDMNYFLRYAEARRAIHFYEEALNELGVFN